jgi:hypothetical protein
VRIRAGDTRDAENIGPIADVFTATHVESVNERLKQVQGVLERGTV